MDPRLQKVVNAHSSALLVGRCRPALAIAAAFSECSGMPAWPHPPLASTSTSVSMIVRADMHDNTLRESPSFRDRTLDPDMTLITSA